MDLSAFQTREDRQPTSEFVAACPYPDGLMQDVTQTGGYAWAFGSSVRFGSVPRFLYEFGSSKTRTEIAVQRNQNRLVRFSVLRFGSSVLTEL
jgi:hypothetical protein